MLNLQSDRGINVHNLKPGIIVLVSTKNSTYKIVKGDKDKHHIIVQGGSRFPEPTDSNFAGSTWGGSMIKTGWIGYGMHMEIHVPSVKKSYITSRVWAAKVIGDGWEYEMEWSGNLIEVPIITSEWSPETD